MRRVVPGRLLPALAAALLWLAACQPARLQITPPAPGAAPPINIAAPTPTGEVRPTATPPAMDVAAASSLTLWVNETSSAHEAALHQIAADFQAASGVNVELRLVAPRLLPELVQTAAISAAVALPDLILHPVEYSVGWAEQGILAREAAAAALETLGADTFNQEALDLVAGPEGPAALPSSGYPQLLIYRQDWFTDDNLAPPVDFAAMLAGAAARFDRDNFVAGFVVPTE